MGRRFAVAAFAVIAVLALWTLAPIGRPTAEDAAPDPTAIPVGDIPVPPGGLALFYGPEYCCNLIVVAPDGVIRFQLGVLNRPLASNGYVWTWQPQRGTIQSIVHIDPAEAASFVSTAEAITPAPGGRLLPHIDAVARPTFDRGTIWGVVRSGSVDSDYYYRGEADPYLAYLGNPPPPTEMVMPAPAPFPSIPSDAVAFIYESSLFVVHLSGAVTMQTGEVVGRDTGSTVEPAWLGHSFTYDVRPIPRLLAWRIVTLARFVYEPPGCPGLDDAATYRYLVIVDARGVSGGLFCHSWSPLRDDLMSVVQTVFQDRSNNGSAELR